MKKLLSILIMAMIATTAVAATPKKEIKKHKKAEASIKVADDKPTAPAKKKK